MDRRTFVVGAGGLLLSSGGVQSALAKTKAGPVMPSDACQATLRMTPGPYLTPDNPMRADIREDLPGAPLQLNLRVMNQLWCAPIEGAVVDVWHCDAIGRYAGFENIEFDRQTLRVAGMGADYSSETFLRGRQVTDEKGVARFASIVPGWYFPRLPHIHVRVVLADQIWTAFDTQLFFPGDVTDAVYETAPYADRGPMPFNIKRDILVKGDKQTVKRTTLAMAKDGEGYQGDFEIAMDGL